MFKIALAGLLLGLAQACNITITQYIPGIVFNLSTTWAYVGEHSNCHVDVEYADNDVEVQRIAEGDGSRVFLVPSSLDVCLERAHKMLYIASITALNPTPTHVYGGQILVNESSNIQHPADLVGKRIAGVKFTDGSFLLQWYELRSVFNVDVLLDSDMVLVSRAQDVMNMLSNGSVDAGFIVAGARQIIYDRSAFRVLIPRTTPMYPYILSTDVIPQLNMLVKSDTIADTDISRFTSALMAVPASISQRGGPNAAFTYAGWFVPRSNSNMARMLTAIGVLESTGQCGDTRDVVVTLQCPPNHRKVSPGDMQKTCLKRGVVACENSETQCVCQPCVRIKLINTLAVILISVFIPVVVVLATFATVLWYRSKHVDRRHVISAQLASIFGQQHAPQVHHLIGSGSFGDVYKGMYDGKEVAFKVTRCDSEHEGSMMVNVKHDNIIETYAYAHFKSSIKELWIVLEYCRGGSLAEAISTERLLVHGRVNANKVCDILYDIADGMACLHSQRILHGDLHTSNVLLQCGTAKVCDFGLVRSTCDWKQTHTFTKSCGKISHASPEMLRGGSVSPRVDVYAFGILAWECLHNKFAYFEDSEAMIVMSVTSGVRPPIDNTLDLKFRTLLHNCWNADMYKRPTWENIKHLLRHE